MVYPSPMNFQAYSKEGLSKKNIEEVTVNKDNAWGWTASEYDAWCQKNFVMQNISFYSTIAEIEKEGCYE